MTATCPWHCHRGWRLSDGIHVACNWCRPRNGDPLESDKPAPRRNQRVTAIIRQARANAQRPMRTNDGAA